MRLVEESLEVNFPLYLLAYIYNSYVSQITAWLLGGFMCNLLVIWLSQNTVLTSPCLEFGSLVVLTVHPVQTDVRKNA